MTQILRAATDADFLAMTPALVGFTPHNSLVCVMFAGKRSAGALRVDLPARRRTAEYNAVANAAVAIASRNSGTDRLAFVIYTDSTFEAEQGIPWLEFARLCTRRADGAGFGITGSFCVAGDGWGSYRDPEQPRNGHPLSEIEDSPLQQQAADALGESLPDFDDLGRLPQRNPSSTTAFELARRSSPDSARYGALDPVSWVELCAEWSEGDVPLDVLAHLVKLAQAPANRDAMMLQFAFGSMVGEAIDELDGLIMGRGSIGPEVDRVKRAITMLGFATAHMPERMRPAPLCMLSWLSWALGLGSAAGGYVDAALAIDPDYGMGVVLRALYEEGRLPEWAFQASQPER
jgi:hypothetical protein